MRIFAVLAAFWSCCCFSANEAIPSTWNINPVLGKVYEVVKPIEGLNVGDRVSISSRKLDDCLGREEPKQMGLLVVGGRNEDDPGITDTTIPLESISTSLKLTNEKAPLTHWQEHYKGISDSDKPNVKPEYWHSNNFPLMVYPAARVNYERPRLILSGSVYRLIKPSSYCYKDEFTIRLEQPRDGLSDRYYEEKRKLSPPIVLAGLWYGEDYCVAIEDVINGGVAQHNSVDPNLPDQMDWNFFTSTYHKTSAPPVPPVASPPSPAPKKAAPSTTKAPGVGPKELKIPTEISPRPQTKPGESIDDLK